MKNLIEWSLSEYAHLPWRRKRSLYHTLVSEIMLQQTTVGTVVNKFEPFLQKFPTIQKLAKAKEADVLLAWEGLGYYRRARNLHKAAKFIVDEFKGKIPQDLDLLVTIPGVGDYTANAMLAIGFDERGLAIDANIERVLARYYGIEGMTAAQLKKHFREEFKKGFLPKLKEWGPRAFHEAIMDCGRTFCQAKKIDCDRCPLKVRCVARKKQNQLSIPFIAKKKEEAHELTLLRVIARKGKKILAYKKNSGEWLTDQWELPTYIDQSTDKKLKQYPMSKIKDYRKVASFKSAITKYKIQNIVIELDKNSLNDPRYQFIDPSKEHLSTASKKALRLV